MRQRDIHAPTPRRANPPDPRRGLRYVLDSSVALKVVLPEADSARAVRLPNEYAGATHALLAPDLFTPEVANGLVSAQRQGRIKPGEAALLLRDLYAIAMNLLSEPGALATGKAPRR
jgi:predicted nucleic acid-binding protein